MKKVLSALLSALVVSATVTALPLSANAASVSQDTQSVGDSVSEIVCDPIIDIVDNSYAVVTGCYSYGNTLVIPSTYKGYPVKEIADYAFFQKKRLVKAVIPSSVTKIGQCAFYDIPNLTTVTLSQGLTEIGEKVFYYCTGLKNISIPSTVKTIGSGAFDSCESIESITVPSKVTSLPEYVFGYCKSLKTVNLPSKLTSIGKNAFYHCQSLSSIIIPEGVKAIEETTFSDCKELKSISLPSTLKTIGYQSFVHCEKLESITIPNGVTSIGDVAFRFCYALKTAVLPSSVNSIGEMAFGDCSSLTSIKIPEGVTAVKHYSFANCTSMKTLTLPSTLKTVESDAFYYCKSIQSLTIPSGVTSIGDRAFRGLASVKKITVPASVTSLGVETFMCCNSLETLTFSKGIKTLPDGVAFLCSSLTKVVIPLTVTRVEKLAFGACNNLATVSIGGKLEYIGTGAFSDTKWVKSQTEGKVFYHGAYALGYNPAGDGEYNAVIKSGTKTICEECFDNNLVKLVIPASVTEIEADMCGSDFWDPKLTDIYYLGTKEQWDKINITLQQYGRDTNTAVKNATIHYDYGHSVATPKLTGASNVNGGVKVAWNAVDGATKYKVFRKTADTDWKALKTVTTTTYTDKTAVSGTTYYYTVRCVSPIDNSVYISSYNTTGLKKTYYAAPVLKTPSNVNGGVKVSWEAVPGASKYKVLRRNADSTTWKAIGYTTSTSYTDKTAESGKTYYYSVRCVKPEDNTSISGYDETGKKKTYYAAPTLKKATNVNGGVTVTWEAVPGASKYKLIRRTADTDWKQIGYTTSTSYTDKTAVSGTTYYYSVRCVNTDNNTALSSIEEPGLKKTYIAAPVLSKIVNTSKGVQLTWAASNGAVNYKVYRKNSAGIWVGIGTTTGTTFYDKEAESGKIYTYTVKCVNENATSAVSGFDNTGKTIKFIAAPVISSLTKTGNGITIKWNAPAGTSNHYKVFWKNENGNWQSIATTTTTSFTDYDVQSGTKYTYTIRVVSADENSNLSGYTSGKSITF